LHTTREFEQLLVAPNESLTIEYKSWLNLQDDDDKAKIAKAAIALANQGGGIVVLGMREAGNGGVGIESIRRPENIRRYHQDDLNAAINRFEPPRDCRRPQLLRGRGCYEQDNEQVFA
jgi:predicted HTH transcriptional regulator